MSTFWDRVAWLYDLAERSNRAVNAVAAARVAELVPVGARVLDCAAGTGEFSLAAAVRAGSVTCTDLSQAMLDQAKQKAKKLLPIPAMPQPAHYGSSIRKLPPNAT